MCDIHKDDVEAQLSREECHGCIRSLIAPAILVAVMSLCWKCPIGMRIGAFGSLCGALFMITCSSLTLRIRDHEVIIRRAALVGHLGLVLRTLMHVVWIIADNDSTFSRCFGLFALPVSSARQSHSVTAFRVYIVVHVLLTVYRFSGCLEDSIAWIGVTIIVSSIAREFAEQRQQFRESRILLYLQNRKVQEIATSTMKSMMWSFCDGELLVNSDFTLLEPSRRFEALIGRKAEAGRSVMDYIDMSDRDLVMTQMEDFLQESSASFSSMLENPQEADKESKDSSYTYMQSLQAHFVDAFSTPVPVHMFLVALPSVGERKLVIGLSEMWFHQKVKKSKDPRMTCKINLATGKLEPGFPQFAKQDTPKPVQELQDVAPPVAKRAPSPRPLEAKFALDFGEISTRAPTSVSPTSTPRASYQSLTAATIPCRRPASISFSPWNPPTTAPAGFALFAERQEDWRRKVE